MMINGEKTDFQKRAVRLVKLLGRDCQRQTIVAIQEQRKAATTEDIVRLRDRGTLDARFYMSSYRVEEGTLGTLGTLGERCRLTNDLPCRSDGYFGAGQG